MDENLKIADEMLNTLIELANNQVKMAKQKNYFSKDLAEAVGVIISLTHGRYGKND